MTCIMINVHLTQVGSVGFYKSNSIPTELGKLFAPYILRCDRYIHAITPAYSQGKDLIAKTFSLYDTY